MFASEDERILSLIHLQMKLILIYFRSVMFLVLARGFLLNGSWFDIVFRQDITHGFEDVAEYEYTYSLSLGLLIFLRGEKSGLYVDLGAYGPPRDVKRGKVWDAKSAVRRMEHWTRDAGGFQALYTDIFCTPRELRKMFDFTLLDAARKELGSVGAFPEVYDKVRSEDGISDLSQEIRAEEKLLENACSGDSGTNDDAGKRWSQK